ncbi:MAG: helix-turn-helix transcriptional regulator [Alphaproteobacteria bacterium]|nr:helix-turn-helix transcriptional regulator [Alphaproteobacteria bacterium]
MFDEQDAENLTVTEKNRKAMASRWRDLWIRSNLNQDEFAKSLEVAPSTFKNWISGRSCPTIDTLLYICEKHDISFYWLATGQGTTQKAVISQPLDEALLTEIVEYIDSEFKFEKAKNKAPLIVKIYAYILKKRAGRKASKEENTAEIIDLIEVLKSAV